MIGFFRKHMKIKCLLQYVTDQCLAYWYTGVRFYPPFFWKSHVCDANCRLSQPFSEFLFNQWGAYGIFMFSTPTGPRGMLVLRSQGRRRVISGNLDFLKQIMVPSTCGIASGRFFLLKGEILKIYPKKGNCPCKMTLLLAAL